MGKVWKFIGGVLFIFVIVFIFLLIINPYTPQKIHSASEKVSGKIIETKESFQTKICPKEIIPKKVIIFEAEGTAGNLDSLYYLNSLFTSKWDDGTEIKRFGEESMAQKIDDLFGLKCEYGKESGENINYLYCKNLFYSPKKTIVNNEGILEESNKDSYKIDLVLFPIQDEEWFERISENSNRVEIYGNYSVIDSFCLKVKT